MRFLLDANALIALLRRDRPLVARLQQYDPSDFGVPAIAAHELFYGAFKGARVADNLVRVEAIQLEVIAFDREDARKAGELRALLARAGTPIGPYDALIAGQALARDLTLITHNLREFQRVPGLKVEDWEAA